MLIANYWDKTSYFDRETALKKERSINSYRKHKQTCSKNRAKRKHKNANKKRK